VAITKCKECGTEISTAATTCPKCGAPRRPQKKTSIFTWIIGGFFALIVLVMVMPRSNSSSASDGATSNAATAATSAQAPWKPSDGTYESRGVDNAKWNYDTSTDAMRHTSDKTATLVSANSEQFAFPYGEAHLAMVVRSSAKFGSNVYLEIRKGQFVCGLESCAINISFNGGKVERFSASEASGGNTDTVFLRVNQAVFVKRLKGAQTVQIEAEYFQEGTRQFTFYPSKLDWP
jgi:predicted nucleic acid-binding Zn ribbon protein